MEREKPVMNAIKEKEILRTVPGTGNRALSSGSTTSVFRARKNELDVHVPNPVADGAKEAKRFGAALRQRIENLSKPK